MKVSDAVYYILTIEMNNIMTQWVKENTRYKDKDMPARLDLLLTKKTDIIESLKYICLIRKSNLVMLEFQTLEANQVPREE